MAAGPFARVLVQVVVAGIAVLSRAIPAAYAQALNNAKKGGVNADSAQQAGGMFARKLISTSEALQVLNVTEEQIAKEPELVQKQYDRYFAANAVEKGGSFYLQSKIYRAKEQLDEFLEEKRREEAGEGAAEAEEAEDESNKEKEESDSDEEGKKKEEKEGR